MSGTCWTYGCRVDKRNLVSRYKFGHQEHKEVVFKVMKGAWCSFLCLLFFPSPIGRTILEGRFFFFSSIILFRY